MRSFIIQKGVVVFLPDGKFVVLSLDSISVMLSLRLLRLRLTGKSKWGLLRMR